MTKEKEKGKERSEIRSFIFQTAAEEEHQEVAPTKRSRSRTRSR